MNRTKLYPSHLNVQQRCISHSHLLHVNSGTRFGLRLAEKSIAMSIYSIMYSCIPLCFVLLIFFSDNLRAATLQSIDIKQNYGKISLVFNFDSAVRHKVFTLTNPDRVVVDFENTKLAFNVNQRQLNKQLIRSVRSGYPNPKTLRLVFEVTDAVILRTNSWSSSPTIQHVISFDISNKHLRNTKKAVIKNLHPSTSMTPRSQNVIVILDPGHGGKDPGAIGPKHMVEKNITLAIAIKLKQLIDKQSGMHAILTRSGDYYVGLRERLTIARQYNADAFISIHADAYINQQSSGASVFALSQRGATSEAARWLAEKENYSELGSVNLQDLDDQSGLVRTVLIDLSQTATISASLHMGEKVLSYLNTITTLHNHKVEQARFMVLKSPDIPSILIETGFISNPREENNLANARYQTQLVQSIFQGLTSYFWEYPPHGSHIKTLLANHFDENRKSFRQNIHVVRPGESLTKIADKYHTSVTALSTTNHLLTLTLKVGQKLILPLTSQNDIYSRP